MARLIVAGGSKLDGSMELEGAKNAVLPIMAASLLTSGETRLDRVPDVQDVRVMVELMQSTGATVVLDGKTLHVDAANVHQGRLPARLAGEIRTSLQMIGALLPSLGSIEVALPGGDKIGARKIDLHLKGLSALGASIDITGRWIRAQTDGLKGADFALGFPSVGATENILIAACLAEGTTVIRNAAREPEIVDLAGFLASMGAKIQGAGTGTIEITGVEELKGTTYAVMPDRINAATYMIAAATTHGDVMFEGTDLSHLGSLAVKLSQAGVHIAETALGVRVTAQSRFQPLDIVTDVYPGFVTDMQPLITPLLALAEGQSTIKETVFDSRFKHIPALRRMGASIEVKRDTVVIHGVEKLTGARVTATDIRAGAALVIAGLVAQGESVIDNVYEIDRGYDDMEGNLRGLGASIRRVK